MKQIVADSVGRAMASGMASNMGSQLSGFLGSMFSRGSAASL